MISHLQFLPKDVQARKDLDLRAGDTVRVHVKIQEKGKTRIQLFEGLVLATKHGKENGSTFTVRKISNSIGVERIFPLYSPNIDKIEIIKRSKVRRSKLYFLRTKVARDIRRKMRNFIGFTASTEDLSIAPEDMMEETVEDVVVNEAAAPVGDEAQALTESSEEAKAE